MKHLCNELLAVKINENTKSLGGYSTFKNECNPGKRWTSQGVWSTEAYKDGSTINISGYYSPPKAEKEIRDIACLWLSDT